MEKDFVINTSSLNSWGTRVLTSGLDIGQFKRNPVLLYMHKRGFEDDRTPIGRVENIRVEGDDLIGTPVFDTKDPFAAEIGRKWDENFLRMCSAGAEPIEFSSAAEYLLPGQTRATVTRSKLIEVSIVDIGSNDDALQLYHPDGKLLTLSTGGNNAFLPMLEIGEAPENKSDNNNQNNLTMNKILLTLGLPVNATEQDAVNAITQLQTDATKAKTIELARIEAAVDTAINRDKKVTADKREHLITLGKTSGFDILQSTLDMLTPSRRPSDIVVQTGGAASNPTVALSYSQMPEDQLLDLRENNRAEYLRLYKEEFGFIPEIK